MGTGRGWVVTSGIIWFFFGARHVLKKIKLIRKNN